MKTLRVFSLCVVLGALASCTQNTGSLRKPPSHNAERADVSVTTKDEALGVVSRIREKMNFDEVSLVLPQITKIRPNDGEQGGVWYFVPIGGGYTVSLRFEHPRGRKYPNETKSIHECLVNFPPALDGPGIEQ